MPVRASVLFEWWKKFDAKTADLSQAEYGAYRLMVNYYFEYSELPASRAQIYVIARAVTMNERMNVDNCLVRKFEHQAGRYIHHEVEGIVARRNIKRLVQDHRAISIAGKLEIMAKVEPVRRKGGRPKKLSIVLEMYKGDFPLPAWVPRELWDAWIGGRRLKTTVTIRTLGMALAKLDGLRVRGHSPAEVLKQAIARMEADLRPVGGMQER